jgi:2-polyprenyl-3-methyl-5-hydroxy-6-metoxy-1,4-benzoquinol methylase
VIDDAREVGVYESRREGSCLACGSDHFEHWADATDVEYFTTERCYSYYRCRDCDCLWIDPVPLDALDKIYPSNYYSYSEASLSVIATVKNVLDRRFFRSHLGDTGGASLRLLDVGGGSGLSLNLAREADSRVTDTVIVDLDAGAQSVAEKNGHTFFHGRFEDYETSDTFDCIFLLNLIEHVANPGDVLRKVGRLLKPGGKLLIKTPNWRSYDQFLFRHDSWGGFHCPRHWVLFTLPGFRTFANACGLDVVSAQYTQGAPFWAVSVLDSLRKRGLVSIGPDRPACEHPLFGVLCGVFACVDLLRKPFAHPSQMFFILRRKPSGRRPLTPV